LGARRENHENDTSSSTSYSNSITHVLRGVAEACELRGTGRRTQSRTHEQGGGCQAFPRRLQLAAQIDDVTMLVK
jgi:hypothetical protein